MDIEEFFRHFPAGDWLARCHWRESSLYTRAPSLVEEAMRALSWLVGPEQLEDLFVRSERNHPLRLGMLDAGYICFWPAFKIGFDPSAVNAQIPDSLRGRRLHPDQVHGAQSELAAAASLCRSGVSFDWYPKTAASFEFTTT